ncbi:MAG: hypothetical protein HGA22_15025 [Clostridiales bacterium]|nr:hypothetical protein [Clostridiales bacterium]
MATGLPVVNGVHYYPQRSLWDYLDPYHAKDSFYNRYAHVCFASGHMSGDETFRIENPSPDVVVVVVDGSRFDFRTIPADFLVTNEANSSIYDKNSTLSLRLVNNGWRVYQVNR